MSSSKPKGSVFLAALALVGLVASSCSCGDSPTKGQVAELRTGLPSDPEQKATYLLDFGDVTVGARLVESIEFANIGARPLVLVALPVAEPFSVELLEEGVEVEVGGARSIGFGFAPFEPTEVPVEAIVTVQTNEKGDPLRTIRLVGRGVPPRLSCTPSPVDFGKVVRGSDRSLSSTCTNSLDIPLVLAGTSFRGNSASSFSASLGAGVEAPVTIPAGGSITIDVRFRAEIPGLNEGVLVLQDPNDQLLGTLPLEGFAVTSSLRVDPASCLDFGYVDLGSSARKVLNLQNVGTETLDVLGLELMSGDVSDFSVHAQTPIRLVRDEGTSVEVEFEPTTGGRRTSTIEIVTSDATVTACVSGFGGGPKLVCTAEAVDFGQVAVGSPVVRTYKCWNDGYAPTGEAIDPLTIDPPESDQPAFEVVIVDDAGNPIPPNPKGYELGEGFIVQVTFAPTDLGGVSGNAIFTTNASGGQHLTPLFGEGVDLPPCDFSVVPPRLRFGIVDRGAQKTQLFGVVNNLQTACLISALRLSETSDPSFVVEELGSYQLAGGETLEIPVTFGPSEYGDFSGEVEFQISNPDLRDQRVSLQGRSANPCILVEPDPVDFGATAPNCESRDQAVSLRNTCGVPVTITDVGIDDTLHASSFQMRRLPELPMVLEPHGRTEALVRFRPKALGTFEGSLYVEVEGSGTEPDVYLSGLVGEGSDDAFQTDRFLQQDRPKVDVLWVIDNSGSMSDFQRILSERLPQFLSYAMAQDIDFQIGVTTTSLTLFPSNICCPGGAQCVEYGRLFPIDSRQMTPPWPRILSRRTANVEDVWSFNVMVGICSGAEMPLEAARIALSPPLINSSQDPRTNKTGSPLWDDGNIGFLRDDAALSIVMVTDEMDHSDAGLSPLGYVEAYRSVKNARFRESVKVHAITVPRASSPLPTCGWFMNRGDRIIDVVDATKGEWFNICTPTNNAEVWDAALERMSRGAFGMSLRYVLRGKPGPRTGTGAVTDADIEVYVDGQRILPKDGSAVVWTYDPVGNAVDFMPLFIPKPGSNISVNYRVACITD